MITLTYYRNEAVLQLLKSNKEFNTVVMNAENKEVVKKHLNENYLLTNNQIIFILNSLNF